MIRMQKQKEEAKKEAERQAALEIAEQEANGKCGDEQESNGQEGGLSVLGIGGKQIRTGAAKKVGKKRTPGEIRIQKGIS